MARWGQVYDVRSDAFTLEGTSRIYGRVAKELKAVELTWNTLLFSGKTPETSLESKGKSEGYPTKPTLRHLFKQLEESGLPDVTRPTFVNLLEMTGRYKAMAPNANGQAQKKVTRLARALSLLMAARLPRIRTIYNKKQQIKHMTMLHEEDGRKRKTTVSEEQKLDLQRELGLLENELRAIDSFMGDLITALRQELERAGEDMQVSLGDTYCLCIYCWETEDAMERAKTMVRTFCGHRMCLHCFAKQLNIGKICPVRCADFQAVEVGTHVAFQENFSNMWMPTVKSVNKTCATREMGLTEDERKEFNKSLDILRKEVLKRRLPAADDRLAEERHTSPDRVSATVDHEFRNAMKEGGGDHPNVHAANDGTPSVDMAPVQEHEGTAASARETAGDRTCAIQSVGQLDYKKVQAVFADTKVQAGSVKDAIMDTYRSWVEWARKDYPASFGYMRQAVVKFEAAIKDNTGDTVRHYLGQTQCTLGLLHLRMGEYQEAREWYSKSLETMAFFNNAEGQGDALGHLAVSHYAEAVRNPGAAGQQQQLEQLEQELQHLRVQQQLQQQVLEQLEQQQQQQLWEMQQQHQQHQHQHVHDPNNLVEMIDMALSDAVPEALRRNVVSVRSFVNVFDTLMSESLDFDIHDDDDDDVIPSGVIGTSHLEKACEAYKSQLEQYKETDVPHYCKDAVRLNLGLLYYQQGKTGQARRVLGLEGRGGAGGGGDGHGNVFQPLVDLFQES